MDKQRLHYVNWLRVLVILTLIPFHAALTYLKYGTVYIKAPIVGIEALPFVVVSALLSDFFMTLLFFLSGIASFYSFRSRQADRYIKERTQKLLLPFVLGTLFLCPVQGYIKAVYENYQGGFIQFIPRFFGNFADYLGYAHFWFLLYLFIFSLIGIPLFKRWQGGNRAEKISRFLTKGNRILLPAVLIILFEFFLRPFFNGNQAIIGDWANDTVYLCAFLFGYFYAGDSRIQNKVKEYYTLSKILGLLSLALLLFLNIQWDVNNATDPYLLALWGLGKGVYECSAIVFLLCFGSKHLNKTSRPLQYLSKSSFTLYIFHFLPVAFFTLIFIRTPLNIYVKYILTVILSYIAVFIMNEAVLKLGALKRIIFGKHRNEDAV